MRVLITSSSKFFREALKFILHNRAEEVDTALDIGEFKKLTGVNRYDLILCDLDCVFDHIDEFRRWVENNLKDTRVVFFSFDPPETVREKLGNGKATGYINRPLDPEQVIEFIEQIS